MCSDPNSKGLMPAKVSGGTKTAARSKSPFLPTLSGRTCSANASSPFFLGMLCSHRAFCCSWAPSWKPQLRRWEDLGLGVVCGLCICCCCARPGRGRRDARGEGEGCCPASVRMLPRQKGGMSPRKTRACFP